MPVSNILKKISFLTKRSGFIAAVFVILFCFQSGLFAGEIVPTGKYFYIKSYQSGHRNLGYWDQPGYPRRYKKGANIQLYSKDNHYDQQFRFIKRSGGWYNIISRNGGYVNVDGGRRKNGTNLEIWSKKTSSRKAPAQKFRLKHMGRGVWKIYTYTGRAVCTPRKYYNGTNVHIWEDHRGSWMKWYLVDLRGSLYDPDRQKKAAPADSSAGFTDRRSGIRVVFHEKGQIFPASWYKGKIRAQTDPLPKSRYKETEKVIKRELAKYPASVLRKNIKKIYITGKLKFYGVGYAGTNSRDCLYIVNDGRSKTYNNYGMTFHHEFSSILLRNHKRYFNEAEWKRNSKAKHGSSGTAAIKAGRASKLFTISSHMKGFVCQYGMASVENDFNTFAENLFMPNYKFRNAVKKYPLVKNKYRVMINFYRRLDRSFTEDYFKRMR